MIKPKANNRKTLYVIVFTVIIAVGLRFFVMGRGFNFDFESYKIVGDIVRSGGNVYAETTRYNYGPVWLSILGLFREIAAYFSNPDLIFRILIVGLLTVTDVAIAFILKRKFGTIAFVLFLLNPVSIIITGYHNQFDNLALLIGLLGLLMMPEDNLKKIERRHFYAALLIGLSLMTKHLFFILPLWLFIRGKTIQVKLFMLFFPILMFAIGFLPFWLTGYEGIIQNVFMYKSFSNAPLLNALVSPGILAVINPTILLIMALIGCGIATRKLPIFESGLWYLLVLVAFSPAIANQYLAIAMPAIIALGLVFFVPFVILATLLLAGTSLEGLHSLTIVNLIPERLLPYITPHGTSAQYNLIIFSLFIGLVLALIYRYRPFWYRSVFDRFKKELRVQLDIFKR